MKCTIPEISWHNRDPVLSVDVQPVFNNEYYRLASGGTDSHVLIWHLRILPTGATSVEPVSDLTRHQRAVNVVRWSPSGQYLASGDDDANIIVWQQKADELASMLDGETADKEKWSVFKVLRGHKEDVYDISWSPNSLKLISGSVDNSAIIWDLAKGLNDNILTDHKGFVQGVSWDPQGEYIATLSSDRTCRIFNEKGNKVRCRMSKGCLTLPESHHLHGQVVRYYHDDTLKSFFRRLSFSPDGNLLITPSGCLDSGQPNKPLYTSYIYTTQSFATPAAILPSPGQYTVAVKCCPKLFELRSDGPIPKIALPYRMIIAVATRSSVVLYDTQQLTPFAVISNIHYTRLTDLTWSQDGFILAISSTDGFCSLVTFDKDELGTVYVKEDSDEENLEESICEEVIAETLLEEKLDPKKEEKKRPSFLKQWAMKNKSKSIKIETDDKKEVSISKNIDNTMKEKNTNVITIEDSPPSKKKTITDSPSSKNTAPAKLIAVRRKPREQMDITKFLKSPNEPPAKKAKVSKAASKNIETTAPIVVSEDSVAQDAWTCNDKMDVDKPKIDIITIEDSQDMQLVLEESCIDNANDKHSKSLEDFEKFYKMQNKTESKDANEHQKETEKSVEKVKKSDKIIDEKLVDTEENSIVSKEQKSNEKTSDDNTEQKSKESSEVLEVSKEQNSNEKIENPSQMPIEKSNENLIPTNLEEKSSTSTNTLESKCDVESNSDNEQKSSTIVNDIKNKINDLQIQPGSLQRKKVPFITLSSPKSKKKDS